MLVVAKLHEFSIAPYELIDLENTEDISCLGSIRNRFYFVIQLIVSLIALPVLLLIGLFEIPIDSCRGANWRVTVLEVAYDLRVHFLYLVPISFIGIFIPLSTTKVTMENWKKALFD